MPVAPILCRGEPGTLQQRFDHEFEPGPALPKVVEGFRILLRQKVDSSANCL